MIRKGMVRLLVPLTVLIGGLGVFLAESGTGLRNDFTTTPADPPGFAALAALPENRGRDLAYPYPPDEAPAVPPLAVPGRGAAEAATVLAEIEAAARAMAGWQVVAVDAAGLRIEAVATSPVFGFNDDVVIELRPAATAGAPADTPAGLAVHMRSKSRVGRSDLGANRKRVAGFFERLEAAFGQ